MPISSRWEFPEELRPQPRELRFDLEAALRSVVLLHSEIPEDAFTASILGTERIGSGIVIRPDGLVLTIGYLITEAESIWLTAHDGSVIPGHPLGYDYETGFGLVMPLGRLSLPAMATGSAASVPVGEEAYVLSHGGIVHALRARIVARREFAGYWEYVLDEAIFTAPAHPLWSGAALLGADGRLLGVGSLLVQEQMAGETIHANMFVPIDLLGPILDDLATIGRPASAPRPWLGWYAAEIEGQIVVNGLVRGGPAARAGVQLGDQVLEVAGERPAGLADLFRKIWSLGPVGTSVPLTLARGGSSPKVTVRSADRNDFLRKPQQH